MEKENQKKEHHLAQQQRLAQCSSGSHLCAAKQGASSSRVLVTTPLLETGAVGGVQGYTIHQYIYS